MRSLARPLCALCSAASLLLGFAVAAAGARSLSSLDKWQYESAAGWLATLTSKGGRVDLVYLSPWNSDEPGVTHFAESAPFALRGPDYGRRVLGFGAGTQLNGGRFVNVPYWLLVLVLLLPPLLAIRSALVRRKRRHGTCPACGYDLRATPERCPECGAAATRSGTLSKRTLHPGDS